ncbi:hypothetical protein HanRHA438_Chr02g0065931 [Helianthus annuus]|nr:hypothetical protein HanRHA438_Chr02g0065931 [Helianthus annuus]
MALLPLSSNVVEGFDKLIRFRLYFSLLLWRLFRGCWIRLGRRELFRAYNFLTRVQTPLIYSMRMMPFFSGNGHRIMFVMWFKSFGFSICAPGLRAFTSIPLNFVCEVFII